MSNERGLPPGSRMSIGQLSSLACLLEVTAPKPGNVHRGADFDDVTYLDFAIGAQAIAPAVEAAARGGALGKSVYEAVAATRSAVGTNTNLGTVLLLVPLAMSPQDVPLADGVARVLRGLTPDDAYWVYEAIRLARPGGLGRVETADIMDAAPADLISAMRQAAGRDIVARQYAEDFATVLQQAAPWLAEGLARGWPLSVAIVQTHLRLMAELPDTLVARKCGRETAQRAADHATAALQAGQPGETTYDQALAEFDFWLRSDGHRRNPGATADLIAAGLFVLLRDGIIQPPYKL